MSERAEWLFFDVGSTLVDEHLAYERRLREMAELTGVPYTRVYETALSFYRQNRKGDLETARSLGIELPKWHKEDEKPYPDAVRCLEILKSRYRIGVIANQSLGTSERLAQYGLLPHIDLVIASAEEGVAKPNRRIFELALERSCCKPEQAVMIGDRIDNDIIPAKRLGMGTVWIRQGFGQYWQITQEEETPDYTVQNLTELCELLWGRNSNMGWKAAAGPKVDVVFPVAETHDRKR